MSEQFRSEIEASRGKLLAVIPDGADVTFIRIWGNVGDHLIYAGTRQLLSDKLYREISIRDVAGTRGSVAIVAGSGGWCNAFHSLPDYLDAVERQFDTVIIYPSSFDVSVPAVKQALGRTNATVFARERESYEQIRSLCRADLAHDCAFFYDFRPYQRNGQGILNAFRTDLESGPYTLPRDNNDLSLTCDTLDEWLWTIARHQIIRTDRAHVTIAAAMLGKRVQYRPSNYHKVAGIVQFALGQFPVERLEDDLGPASIMLSQRSAADEERSQEDSWRITTESLAQDLAAIVPAGESFILIDNGILDVPRFAGRRVIPFTERAGTYWGPPADDENAILELQRLLEVRPAFVAFAWPAFWWLDHYPGMCAYLESSYQCIRRDERLIVFDLRTTQSFT